MTDFREDLVAAIPKLRAFAKHKRFVPSGTSRTEFADVSVDDLVQHTLMKALQYEADFAPGTKLEAWLSMIMQNHFLNGRARAKLERRYFDRDVELAYWSDDRGGGADAAVPPAQEWRVELLKLTAAMQKLSAEKRHVLEFIFVGGNYTEAAARFNITSGTTKTRVFYARAELWTALTGETIH